MNYFLLKLAFDTAVHFGGSDSAVGSQSSALTLRADTIFSALCHTALEVYGEPALEELLVSADADALRISLVTRQHGPRPGVEAVGHAADGNGAARQRAGASRVVPGPAVEDPSGRHRAGAIEPVCGAIALMEPDGHGVRRGIEPVPGPIGIEPARMQRDRID